MEEQTTLASETIRVLTQDELSQVSGAASIYINGMYWGEGELDLRPWPSGFRVRYI